MLLFACLRMLWGQHSPLTDDTMILAETFLEKLYTVTRSEIAGEIDLDTPSMAYAQYLERHFGAYCEEEMLEVLLRMRFPFQLMHSATESGHDVVVDQVALSPVERAQEADTGYAYTVSTHTVRSDGSQGERKTYTGRITLRDTQNGPRVVSMSLGPL